MIGVLMIEDTPEPSLVHRLPARLAQVEVIGRSNGRSERREGVQLLALCARRELEHRETVIRIRPAG